MNFLLRYVWSTNMVMKFFFGVCGVLIVGYFSSTTDHDYGGIVIPSVFSSKSQISHNIRNEVFTALNAGGVFSFKNVCIEVHDTITKQVLGVDGFLPFIEKKTLTVYSSEATQLYGNVTKTFTVAGRWISRRWWTLTLVDGPVPSTHTFHNVGAAYFLAPSFPGNLHHFWEDEFLPLWNAMKHTNRLQPQNAVHPMNAIVYRLPYHLIRAEYSHLYNVTRYEPVLRTLGVERTHEVFWQKPTNTCYANAVFGSAWIPLANVTKRDAAVHVVTSLIKENEGKRPYVTLIQRRSRRFINISDMLQAAKDVVGEEHARVVDLEDHDVVEQVKFISETCVLIGVNGAGLQWAMLLRETNGASEVGNVIKPTVIEVAWPRKFWNFYFKDYASEYGINHNQLEVSPEDVHPNWTTYERACFKGQKLSEAFRQSMLSPSFSPKPGDDHVWKFSDVVVDISQLRKLLSETDCGRAYRQ